MTRSGGLRAGVKPRGSLLRSVAYGSGRDTPSTFETLLTAQEGETQEHESLLS
jgi:hypothetical protein